jgi:flavodoxin
MSNKAVVFFSRNGSTRGAAALLATRLDAEMIELKPLKKTGFLRSGYMAAKKKGAELEGDPWQACADKDLLILGTPVWAGNGTPAINSFLDKADFNGKKVYLFTFQADPRMEKAPAIHSYLSSRIEAAGGVVSGTFALHGASSGKTADEAQYKEKVNNWVIV